MSTEITLSLPDELYQQAQKLAQERRRPVTEILVEILESSLLSKTTEKSVSNSENLEIVDLRKRLQTYETQYKMSSDSFYQRFRSGELGDDIDFFQMVARSYSN